MTRGRNGSLLIVTLWLVTLLAVVAVAIGRYLSLSVKMARFRLAREEARSLARGGVYLAMQRLAEDAPEAPPQAYDWEGDDWASPAQDAEAPGSDPSVWVIAGPRAGGGSGLEGRVSIRITDEERKLNLNAATLWELTAITGDLGLAQEIVDARDEADPAEDRPSSEPPYAAKNGPFAVLEELADLPGMSADAYQALAASTSPYVTAGAAVNINTASVEALRLLGATEPTVQMVMRFREGPDGPQEHAQDGIFGEPGLAILQRLKDSQGVDLTGTPDGNLLSGPAFGVVSQTFLISAEGAVDHPAVRARIQAIVRRTACPEHVPAPCIVAWRES